MKILSPIFDFLQGFNKSKRLDFRSNGLLTLGVEIELQIIDPSSLSLAARAEEILKITSSKTKKIKQEFFQNTIEINTEKCQNVHEVEKDLSRSFDVVSEVAKSLNLKFATTGCHPFARYDESKVSPSPRYNQLIDRNQWLARRMTVYGLHVHLGMKNGDDAIRFNNFFLNFIPHLLALSASSPFWQGSDAGLASCRATTYESLPTAGHPYPVKSWNEFQNLFATLKKCKAINSLKDLWWDIRPSPVYGTLEIRVCDGLSNLAETVAIVAFIHLLASWFNDNGTWLEQVPTSPFWFSRENKWRAIRHGLNADLVTNIDGATKPIDKDILEWLEKLEPYAEKLRYKKYVKILRDIVAKGNSTTRQRKIFGKNNSLQDVVNFNIKEFLEQKPIWQ